MKGADHLKELGPRPSKQMFEQLRKDPGQRDAGKNEKGAPRLKAETGRSH